MIRFFFVGIYLNVLIASRQNIWAGNLVWKHWGVGGTWSYMVVLRLLSEFIKDEKKAERKPWGKITFRDIRRKLIPKVNWEQHGNWEHCLSVSANLTVHMFLESSVWYYISPCAWKGFRLKAASVLPINQYF